MLECSLANIAIEVVNLSFTEKLSNEFLIRLRSGLPRIFEMILNHTTTLY